MSDEERLGEAALNLRHVGDTSIPVILNIIGNDFLTKPCQEIKELETCS